MERFSLSLPVDVNECAVTIMGVWCALTPPPVTPAAVTLVHAELHGMCCSGKLKLSQWTNCSI